MDHEEGLTYVNLINEDHTDFLQAVCAMTDEQTAAFLEIAYSAEDYIQQCLEDAGSYNDESIKSPVVGKIVF